MLTDNEINQRFNQMDYPSEKISFVSDKLGDIAEAFIQFAEHMDTIVPDWNPRAKALLFTKLEEAQMWAEKATKVQTD